MTLEALYAIYRQHPVITTDTRECPPGSLFFALKGARFNGNGFAPQALAQGCAYAVVDEPPTQPDPRMICVDDVLRTLQRLARHHRRQLTVPVIGITGTNGKTTTKELAAAALGARYNVLCTEGNLNNHIGVPLTLLRIRPGHEIAVVEMGASRPGEIRDLAAIAEPDFGIVTNVGKAHLEGFGSFEGVVRTKSELYDFLRAHGGTVFVNADDPVLLERAEGIESVRYGASDGLFVSGTLRSCDPCLSFDFRHDGVATTVRTQLVGGYNLANALAATAIALRFGVEPHAVARALESYAPQNKRSQLQQTARNTLILDAYNANPTSMAAALENFVRMPRTPKAVVLGDMGELGPESRAEHAGIVRFLETAPVDRVLLAGAEFSAVSGRFTAFPDTAALAAYLKEHPLEGYLVLVKGSRFMHLEQAIPEL